MSILRKAWDGGEIDLSDVIDPATAPVAPVAPGELPREEWLEALGITAYRLAKDIGIPPNRVTAFLVGERAITTDTALRLARYFGTDAESWINMQNQYDLDMERRTTGDAIARAGRPRVQA